MLDKEGENKYDSSGSSLNAFIHKTKTKSSIQYTAGSMSSKRMARNCDDFDARTRTQRPQHTILVVECLLALKQIKYIFFKNRINKERHSELACLEVHALAFTCWFTFKYLRVFV